jgi:uncharacterized membrane protein YjgN (DUF898 family)
VRTSSLDPALGAQLNQDTSELEEFMLGLVGMLMILLVWSFILGLIGLLFASNASKVLRAEARPSGQPRYDGDWKALFKIYLQNVVFTLLTLGIYRFWAKVRNKRFHYQHTRFAGGRFDYLATGKEKFIGFLKGMVLLVPAFVAVWYAEDWATEMVGAEFSTQLIGMIFASFLYLLKPLILVGSQRFNLARTTWNNLRLHFSGRVGDAYKLYMLDLAVMIMTFGMFYPWHVCRVRKFRLSHTHLGDTRMAFHGTGGELFGITFLGTFLSYITLGLYLPWYVAARERFFISGTRFRGKRFVSRLTGKDVLAIGGPAMLLSVLTLGLALPWAVARWRALIVHTTRYAGEVDLDEMESFTSAASSTLEGIGEAGDALGELGDLFGV